MGLIVSEVYDALIEAGTSPEKATSAAAAVPLAENMATRDDIARIDANIVRIDAKFAQIDANIVRIDAKFAQIDAKFVRIDANIAAIHACIAEIRANMVAKQELAKIEKDIAVLKFAVFGGGSVMLGAMGTLLKLALFP